MANGDPTRKVPSPESVLGVAKPVPSPEEVLKKKDGASVSDGLEQPIPSPSTPTQPPTFDIEPIGAVAEYDKRMGDIYTQQRQEQEEYFKEQKAQLPSEQTTVGEDIINAIGKGTTMVVKSIMDTPAYAYNLLATPQNFIAEKFDIPELKASAEGVTKLSEEIIPDQINTLKTWANVSDKFGEAIKDEEENIQNKYDQSIYEYYSNGDYSKGSALLATRIAEAIPYTVAIAAGGAAGLSSQAILGGVAMMEGGQKAQELRQNTDLGELDITINSLASGLLEGTFEQVTAGIGKATADILKSQGKEAAKDFAEKSFKEVSKRVLSKYLPATAPIGEGLSEVATQASTALVDKLTVDSSIDPSEGLVDVFLVGMGSGATISTPAYVASRFGSRKNKDTKSEINKRIGEIDEALSNEELSETTMESLSRKRNELSGALDKLSKQEYEEYKDYSQEDLNKVNEINRRLSAIEKTVDEIGVEKANDLYSQEVQDLTDEKKAIEEKYTQQPKEQTDAVQEPRPDDLLETQQAEGVQEVGEEVRSAEEETGETPEGEVQEEITKQVTEDVVTEETVDEPVEGQPKSPTPQKLLGQTPSKTTKKVTMTDKALVKQRIQDMVKASREGYREGRREIKDFTSQIKEMFKEVKSGIFKPSQVRALTTRAAEVSTPTQMKRFEEYATKVLDDAQYAEDLAKSYKTRARVKIGDKAPSNIRSAFQRFKRIDPSKVDNLTEYNKIANGLLGYKGRPTIKAGEEVTASEKQTLPISEINDYIDNYNKSQEGNVKETLIDQNQELVDLGIIDESLTADEIQSIIDAISDPQPDESVFDRMQNSQRKTEAFKRIMSYSQEDLKGIPQQEITKEQREVKDALENIDVDQVESNQLPFLYSALRNAIDNNAYNGAYRIVADYKAQRNIPQAQGLRNKAARTISSFDFNVTNIRSVFRALTGHSEFASRLLNLMGLSSLFDGNAKAQRAKENISKEISNLIGKRFNTIEENVFLSIYDTLLTAGQENFTYYKDAINEMINNDLKSSDSDLRKSAQIAKKVFDNRVKDANNINQIKITASEKKVSDFFGGAFKDIAPRFKDISENVYNIEFIESDNYRPLLWRTRSEQQKVEVGVSNSYFYQRNVRPTKDGSLNQRTYKVDPIRQTFEYDYINGMVNKYANQILDIETAKSVFDYNAFMKHPKSLDALGNDKNKQAINQRIKRYVESNHAYSTLNPVQKMVVDVFNAFAKIGARVKLGGVSQVFVQSIPVFVRTIAILNRDAGTVTDGIGLRVQDNEAFNNLIDNYPISTRGLIRQEFKSAERNIAKATRDKWRNKMGTAYQNIDELLDKIQMLPIEWSDVETAKTTWFAYYLQNLKRRGLYDGSQTMEQLSQNPDDQAASYAEQMVAETQVPSDVQQNGILLVPSDNVANAARRIAFPFIMFRTTQAYSIWNTFTNGIKGIGDKQSQGIFLKELSGVMGENIVFSGFSYARYLASLGAASFIASLFGVDLDKDDEETKKDKYTAWWVKSIGDGLMQLNPIYGYGLIDKMQVRAMNRFYFSVILNDDEKSQYINQKELRRAKTDKEHELVMEKALNNFEKTKNAPVRDWSGGKGDEWYEVLGQAGFLPEIINQAEETFDMSKQEQYEYISKWNTTVEVDLSEEERNLLIMSGILQYANLIAPKELGDAGRRIKSGVIYKGDKGSGRGGGRSSSRQGGR